MCLCSRDERTPERLAEQSPMEGISIEGTNDPTTGDVQEIAGGGRATVTRMGRDLRPEAGGARSRGQCRAIGRGPGRHGPGRPRKSVRLNSCSGNVSWLRFFGQHVPGRNPSLFDPEPTSAAQSVAVHRIEVPQLSGPLASGGLSNGNAMRIPTKQGRKAQSGAAASQSQ